MSEYLGLNVLKKEKKMYLSAILLPILLFLIAWGITMIVITPQQHIRMIETFGRFAGIRNPGLSFKLPFPFQTASLPFSLQTRQITDLVQVKSSDNVFVKIPVNVQFKVIPARAKDAFYELENPAAQMKSYIIAEIRSIASQMDFQKLYDDKEDLSNTLKSQIGPKMEEYGYQVVDILVDDPQPTEDIVRAFNDVTASKRAKEAAAGYGEAERVRRVAEANAAGEAQKITAQATVDAREILAKGNADAIRLSVEGTGLGPEFGHDLVRSSIEAETARDVARQGGKIVMVAAGDKPNALHALLAPRDVAPLGVPKVVIQRVNDPHPLDKDGDGVIDTE